MRRALTILALLSGMGFAQTSNYGGVSIAGSYTTNCIPVAVTSITLQCAAVTDNGTVVTITEPTVFLDGAALTPSIRFAGATSSGLSRIGANSFSASAGGTEVSRWIAAGIAAPAFVGDISNQDAIFARRSAGNWRLGAADLNGTPVAQTISAQGAITGTDLPGKQFSLAGSLGTGAALPLPVVLQGADASVATGTTAQTEISRLVSADTKNLTSGAATTLLSIPLATLQMTGGVIEVYMEATDGTNQCTRSEEIYYSAENSAGVFVTSVSAVGTGVTSCTATKTLTAAYAMTSANPALLQVTPTLTGITATRFTAVYTVIHGGMTNPTL